MTIDYEVEVKPLVPPIGMNKYVARIVHCYVIADSKKTSVDPCVGETWGATRTEARARLHDRMERWISSQS
jgi:hypothetical protein